MTTEEHIALWNEMAARSFDPRDWWTRDDGAGGPPPDPTTVVRGGTIMWVYEQTGPTEWTVGHYKPDQTWVPESRHPSPEAAAERVRYLNGGATTGAGPAHEAAKRGFGTIRESA